MRSPRAMWWVVSRGLVVAALLTGRNAAGDEPPERVVQYAKDALTVRVTRVPVDEILGQLGKQSGAEIRGEVRDRHEITAEFEDVPLPEALHRLLGEQNFALIYGDGGRRRTRQDVDVRDIDGERAAHGGDELRRQRLECGPRMSRTSTS